MQSWSMDRNYEEVTMNIFETNKDQKLDAFRIQKSSLGTDFCGTFSRMGNSSASFPTGSTLTML